VSRPGVRGVSIAGKRVIVTGGSSGLGRAIVTRLVESEARPVNLDRRPPAGEQQDPSGARWCQVDLADTAAAEAVVREVGESGGIDAVVTCAGVDHPGALEAVSREQWERVLAVNLLGTAAVVRAALPWLRRSRGRVVTVASTLGHGAVADATAYCASKWGVVGFTRSLMAELKGEVGVTLLTPGGMTTAFFDDRDQQYRPGPDAVLADPLEVAEAAVFALSRPPGVEVRELVVASPVEVSWP
jgi:NAD(P)-dependent dehydrogenase (short-subunit alcohol dehydrogenase family)